MSTFIAKDEANFDVKEFEANGAIPVSLDIKNWRRILKEELGKIKVDRKFSVSKKSNIAETKNWSHMKDSPILRNIVEKFVDSKLVKNPKFDTMYYVKDEPGTVHRNQEFHFDTIPCLKMIINLQVDEGSSTHFILGSHKSLASWISGILFNISRGRIKIASNGTKWIPGHQTLVKKKIASFHENDAVIFNTNIYHRAGVNVQKRREIIIVTLRTL